MKIPKIRDVVINHEGTKKIRELAKSGKTKITINIDSNSLREIKKLAEKNGASYQKLLNSLLIGALKMGTDLNFNMERLERLEKEVEKLKKKVA